MTIHLLWLGASENEFNYCSIRMGSEIFTIHLLWRGASENEFNYCSIRMGSEIFTIHLLWRGASENEFNYCSIRNSIGQLFFLNQSFFLSSLALVFRDYC
ncbi:MAG: hypothetical protein F6K22_29130 [Okeania sp. SIO2F4]|uniref:hypothetical protein n=1 Tax=Okeania sp. SIO2F4 TaxID=2607790 RepID=UPI00142C27AE|nr:hypothetical protein [Okeania sp. SIO2F4]NES06523.1 hypothetical protein [Okeania sp. SIO2F4]